VAGSNDWSGHSKKIEDSSAFCNSLIPHLNEEKMRERWNLQLQEIRESQAILEKIHRDLEGIGQQPRRIYEDQKERELLQDLSCDYEGYKNFNERRVKGTCEWFFNDDRFRKWRDRSTSSLLWVSAGPGCGKSVLSRALIDERRLSTNATTSIVCYFFFKDGDEGRTDSADALCAILHQLFTQDHSGSLIKHTLDSHTQRGNKLTKTFFDLWRILEACSASKDAGEIICNPRRFRRMQHVQLTDVDRPN
jgi:hypothetical protein